MKPAVYAAAVFSAVAASAVLAAPALAADVEIRNAVARVIVIPEDRTDIGLEITQGTANLPQLQIDRRGGRVRIDGGLERPRGFGLGGNEIRHCRNGPDDARQPGVGAQVEARGVGWVRVDDAPLIVVRTPRDVDVKGSGAVFGAVGRGANSIKLGSSGCGTWTVANVEGPASLSVGGSGSIRAGSSQVLNSSVGGSGSIYAGPTGALAANIGGSGAVDVARVDGVMKVAIGGSGDVRVRGGRASRMEVSIGGSGDVRFDGQAGDVAVSIAGSGDVQVAEATGRVSRSVVGSGTLRIGR